MDPTRKKIMYEKTIDMIKAKDSTLKKIMGGKRTT